MHFNTVICDKYYKVFLQTFPYYLSIKSNIKLLERRIISRYYYMYFFISSFYIFSNNYLEYYFIN